jgi:hypothetical protein
LPPLTSREGDREREIEKEIVSTLEVHTSPAPKNRPSFGGLARVAAAFMTVVHVFGEAQRQAHEPQRRYPFTAW